MQVFLFLTFRLPFGRLLQKQQAHTLKVFGNARKFTLYVKKEALYQHVLDKDHVINWGNVEILKRESHWHRRRVAEGFLINQKALSMNVLNRNDGMIVPSVYNVRQ